MKTYYLHTLGCKVNSYESQYLKEQLEKKGYALDKNNPSLILINTCAVTSLAEHKSRQKVSSFKKKFKDSIVVAFGCSTTLHPDDYNLIDADIILDNYHQNDILFYVHQFEMNHNKIIVVNKSREREYLPLNISSFSEHVRAYVKIADGCNNFCSYCIIPYIRGKFRSRDKEDIISEVKRLLNNGYKEIILTGIDSASFGKDINSSLNDLLKEIVSLEGLERLSLSSLEASEIDQEFIKIFKENKSIARHLHIPLQSGSEHVLKLMNRKYDKEEFLSKIKTLKDAEPDVFLACDVITGFPGETEEDFFETIDFIVQCGFNFLHVFPYSDRDGTYASKLPDHISTVEKNLRKAKLLSLSDRLYKEYQEKMKNKTMHFLIESYSKKNDTYHGLSEYYLPIDIKKSELDKYGLDDPINQIITLKY